MSIILNRTDIDSDKLVVLGDFNTCLNNKLDIVSGNAHPERLVNKFNDVVNSLNIIDYYRVKHPQQKTFTWSRKKYNEPMISRRLDYIFITDALMPFVQGIEIKNLGFSDHRAVIMHADFSTFKRGPSTYKLNKEILKNIDFVNMVKIEITKVAFLSNVLNPDLIWELVKAQIRALSIVYSKSMSRERVNKKEQLQNELSDLETEMIKGQHSQILENKILKTKHELEVIVLAESKGAQIRAGIKYSELGEKCNKFFLSLEKNRAMCNTIFKLNTDNGSINTCDEILTFIMNYYEEIYTNPTVTQNDETGDSDNPFLDPSNVNTLDDEEKDVLDTPITSDDILTALKNMKNDSSPGLDGLPVEVYKVFWIDIKHMLTNCFKFCYEAGHLAPSQSEALICLIHKGGTSIREDIANWRPISLLNADYKILAKLLAMRLQKVLSILIDSNQCAFIKGRGIAFMLREVYDLIEHEKSKEASSILLSIDYSKAFDTLSTNAILKALKLYGFGDYFTRWISILLKDRQCCVRNAGFISKPFSMERGVRQGCPISPILFILTSELFAASVRSDPKIKGLTIPFYNRPVKIRQYADDTTLFLRDLIDYREILSKIKLFAQFAGLELNKKKSYAIRFCRNNLEGTSVYGIQFVSKIKLLGVFFSTKEDARFMEENYAGKIKNLQNVCALWSRRKLSLIGKIIILKTFGISKFIHIIQSIGMDQKQINAINTILFRFLWKKKEDNLRTIERVKRKTMFGKYEEGGLCMTNLECFQDSFLLNWAEKLINTDYADWKAIAKVSLREVGGLSVFNSNVKVKQFKGIHLINNSFWKKVLCTWLDNKNNHDDILSAQSPLFNNRDVKFKNSTIFFSSCILNNIVTINDVIVNDQIIAYDQFQALINTPNSLLIYNCIYNALLLKLHLIVPLNDTPEAEPIGRKRFYHILNQTEEPLIEQYWSRKLTHTFPKQHWLVAFGSTIETRIHILHWKILMNIYPTGTLLFKMRKRQSEECEQCHAIDTLEHFFFHCTSLEKLWRKIHNMINALLGYRADLTWSMVLLGIVSLRNATKKQVKQINLYILLAKLSISKSKYGSGIEPSLIFEAELCKRKMH